MMAWMAGTALCGAAVATMGMMYGRLGVLTVGSAVVVGSILPMLDNLVLVL